MRQSKAGARLIRVEHVAAETFEGGGHHRAMISRQKTGADLTVYHSRIKPGQTHEWHSHESDEAIFVVAGEGQYELEDGPIHYQAGDFIFMPRGTRHRNSCAAKEDVVLVAVFHPAVE